VAHALPPLAFAALVIGAWQLYVDAADVRESILPSPGRVASALWGRRALLASHAGTTLAEIALGFAAAVLVGIGLAILIRGSRALERAVYPWLVVSQVVPVPAVAPLILIWTGFDLRPKVIVIALVSFFPIAVGAVDGLRAAEPALIDLLRTMGATPWQRFRIARAPAALPSLFSGLRVAAALAVIGAVFAEWVGSSRGLGHLVLVFNNETATPELFATIVVLAAIGLGLFGLVGAAERLAIPWYREPRSRPPG
jgi:ABC-type nitrate/sulfonate/bicarbonate transport system permease component